MTMRKVKSLVEHYLLRELQIPGQEETQDVGDSGDSLDSQVNRLLQSYEGEAKNLKNEGFDFRALTRRFLNEAEGDDEGEDEEGGDEEDAGEEEPAEPTKLSLDDIDVASFASSVSRLVDNYDSLLEIRDTLVKMASSFLSKNYDTQVVSTFENTLRDKFDIEVGVTDVDKKYDIDVPNADRAGPSPGG